VRHRTDDAVDRYHDGAGSPADGTSKSNRIIFLSCHGYERTEYAGGKAQPSDLSAETSIKIDLDKKLFFWTYDLPSTKSCSEVSPKTSEELGEWLKHGECTDVGVEELRFNFRIKKLFHETEGSIDRVTGQLFAKTETWDNPQILRHATSWTTWLMTCAPAARQF
jgi:hypothetical protein